jgi:hypothetical protein
MTNVKIEIKINDKEIALHENGKIHVNLEELYEGITPLHELLEYLTSMSKILSQNR